MNWEILAPGTGGIHMAREIEVNVTNVFKVGMDTLEKEYTTKWIELINLLEKNKDYSRES